MATIYRFIVENKYTGGGTGGGSGRKSSSGRSKKSTAKAGRWVSIFGGEKGGVEHNRYMRAVNTVINKGTGGYWEKGMRLGRAGLGLVQRNTETGKLRIGGPAISIIIAFIIQALLKWQNLEWQKSQRFNAQNFKQMETGLSSIHTSYKVSAGFFNGRITYKENK